MKTRALSLSVLGLAVTMAACSSSDYHMSSGGPQLPSVDEIVETKLNAAIHPTENYFLGQVVVETTTEDELAPVLSNLAVQGIKASALDLVPNRPIYLLKIESTQSVPEVVKALRADTRRVVMAETNNKISASSIRANDPLVSTQWALDNYGQEAPDALAGKVGADISLDTVNAEGSHDVVVGVIDTGIDYFHEDLAITEEINGVTRLVAGSNIWTNPEEIPNNGINDDNNGDARHGVMYVDDYYGYNFVNKTGDPMDNHGHGTHVAGVIGALRNNFKGIVGINQKVSLMGLKFLSAEGGGSDWDAVLAIYYAIDMKKRFPNKKFILSNSWGSSGRDSIDGDRTDKLLRAFREASKNDILSVAAAGNEALSNRFFASYPSNYAKRLKSFISVAASNNLDQLADFSSYGFGMVQIAAPGVLIQSTVPAALYETPYAAWSGTSMATPQVSGAAALVWGENPELTAAEVQDRLLITVDVLPQLHGVVSTGGRLNVKRALENDINMSILPVLQDVPYVTEPPRPSSDASYDLLTSVAYSGAQQLSVCFSKINLAPDFDWIEILDENYRVKDVISGVFSNQILGDDDEDITVDLCSAPVLGEKLIIRLYASSSPTDIKGYVTTSLKVLAK